MPSPTNELYSTHKELLVNIARGFLRRYGGELEEWVSRANLIYVEAVKVYTEEKGKLESFLLRRVWSRLMSQVRKASQRGSWYKEHLLEDPYSLPQKREGIDLTKDARTLIKLAVDNPIVTRTKPSDRRLLLTDLLLETGWGLNRILRAFENIREVLR